MAWAAFSQDFDWSPPEFGGAVTIAFKAGMRCSVTRECTTAARQAGKATPMATPTKEEAEQLKADPYWRAPVAAPS